MKENTHLYFAEKVFSRLENKTLKKILEKNFDYYILGSVFPDVFYHNKKTADISQIIHGRGRDKTNELIFDFLNFAKEKQDEKSLAFTLGYISHYVLDSQMHPVVYYFTGNYYDKDPIKRFGSMLRHRQLETFWDKKITKDFILCKKMKISALKHFGLSGIIYEKFGIDKDHLIKIFSECRTNNLLFRNYGAFLLLKVLIFVGIYKNESVKGFFLFTKNKELENLDDELKYQDLITGEQKINTLDGLMKEGGDRAVNLFELTFSYYLRDIPFENLEAKIPGESLDTGKIKYSVEDIVYTKYS